MLTFRTIDGSGNNLLNPDYNAVAGTEEVRIAPAYYKSGTTDGLIDGPNPRYISNTMIIRTGSGGFRPKRLLRVDVCVGTVHRS